MDFTKLDAGKLLVIFPSPLASTKIVAVLDHKRLLQKFLSFCFQLFSAINIATESIKNHTNSVLWEGKVLVME